MKEIPIIEIFGGSGKEGNNENFCLQGEGKFVGTPSIFIRVFGCNLKCTFNDFSNREINSVRYNANKFNSLKELPILNSGCDTYYSIYSQFKKFTKSFEIEKLIENVKSRLSIIPQHLVITGGEPLLPNYQNYWSLFLPELIKIGITKITFETNGTQKLTDLFKTMLKQHQYKDFEVYFSISPKLSNSGYKSNSTLFPEIVREYILFSKNSWLKYVISPRTEIEEILFFNKSYNIEIPIYLMPQSTTKEEYQKNESFVYKLCCELGFYFSPRLQVSALNNCIGA